MAEYTREIATEFNFPNITVYRKFCDGVQYGWRFESNEGYVMYDTTAEDTEPWVDPDTDEIIPVPTIYYYTNVDCPLRYDWDNFTWVAVLRSSVPEDHIFGVDNDHVVA